MTEDIEQQHTFVRKDAARQIVTGPALIPDKPDKEGDVVRKSTIEDVAYDYMSEHQMVDEMHDEQARDGHSVVESYVAPQDIDLGDETVPEGSWIVSVKLSDDAWKRVEQGEFTGFSIQGAGSRQPLADDIESEVSG